MILALSYVIAMFWAQLGTASLDISMGEQGPKTKKADVARTISESNFILSDYGVWFEPRKLGRKERLALALTNLAETGQ